MPFFGSSKPKKASTKSKKPSAATEPIPQSKPLFPTRPPIQAQSQYNLSSPPPNYYSPQSQQPPKPIALGSPPAPHPYRYPPAYGPGPAASQALLPLPQPPPLPTINSWPSGNPQQNKWQSCTNLAISIANPIQTYNDGLGGLQQKTTDCLNRGAALCDVIGTKFNDVISMIDDESFSGDEKELGMIFFLPKLREPCGCVMGHVNSCSCLLPRSNSHNSRRRKYHNTGYQWRLSNHQSCSNNSNHQYQLLLQSKSICQLSPTSEPQALEALPSNLPIPMSRSSILPPSISKALRSRTTHAHRCRLENGDQGYGHEIRSNR
jgi:hypothetical protein